jgi:hypothetical protein
MTPSVAPYVSTSASSKILNDYVSATTPRAPLSNPICAQQLGDSLGKGAFGQVYRTSSRLAGVLVLIPGRIQAR